MRRSRPLPAATVGAAYLHLGNLTIVAALTIAVAKTSLILLYFMHIRFSGRRLWVFATRENKTGACAPVLRVVCWLISAQIIAQVMCETRMTQAAQGFFF